MKAYCLVVLCLIPPAGAGVGPDGWVVAIDGKWSRNGHDLGLYSEVFANDKLAATSGTIEVALKDGQSPHRYRCDTPSCTFTIPGFRPAEDSILTRLSHAFEELATHRDTMPVSAISRGREQLRQAVLEWKGGRLDLTDAVRSIDTGLYVVSLRPIETAAQERIRGSLHWDPPAATFATFPAVVTPGIYQLTMSSSEGDSIGAVAVLITSAAEYADRRKAFAAAAQSLPQDLDPATLDAFRNALLFKVRDE
jgi:hypothetical protein